MIMGYNCPHCTQGVNNGTLGDMNLIRILVSGWRFWPEDEAHRVYARLNWAQSIYAPSKIVVVEGACHKGGVDQYAYEWAMMQDPDLVATERHPAIYAGERLLGPERNSHMVNLGFHLLLSFPQTWTRKTGGTWDCTRKAQMVSANCYIDPYSLD